MPNASEMGQPQSRRHQSAEAEIVAGRNLLPLPDCIMGIGVKAVSFDEVKKHEAASRMAAVRKARRTPKAAVALQQRASLVGGGAKWRISNFKQVARAMSKWA